jgi:hypothetical protein
VPPESLVYLDVHSIEVHPSSPDVINAVNGGGFGRPMDGGQRRQLFYAGTMRAATMHDC